MSQYTDQYYGMHKKGAIQSAENVLDFIYNRLEFKTLADFGCGIGCWAWVAKNQFNAKVMGVDFHECTNILLDDSEYICADLTKPLNLECSFDLVIALEVAEHIEEPESSVFLDNICLSGKRILFSAALPGQGGTGHVNEKPLSYWIERFEQKGYFALDVIRPKFWNCEDIEIWYRNNSILVIHESLFSETANKFQHYAPMIDVIHPMMLQRIISRRIG